MRDSRSLALLSLPFALLVAACGADADAPTTGSQPASSDGTAHATSSLVAGTSTSLHPEVGELVRASGRCTATLFAPQYFITAAHCLDVNDYTNVAVKPDDVFRLHKATGGTLDIPVDRLASFATARYEYVPGTTTTTDLAIGRLFYPVPPDLAAPRPLATQLPPLGAPVTLFGFGCTDRTNTTGTGGFKQYVSFLFGTPTTSLCPGDSGGPAVTDAFFDRGEIWGINSDYIGLPGQFPTWIDLFGNVPAMKPRIEEQMRAWDGKSFDADGRSDVLWWHPETGALSAWFLSQTTVRGDGRLSWTAAASSGWEPVVTADMNGDGFGDVVWYHGASGAVSIWNMAGTAVTRTTDLTWTAAASTGWRIVGAGDFDRDNATDLLWYNGGTGQFSAWLLDGATVKGSVELDGTLPASSGWQVFAVADMNNDGNVDILWYEPGSGTIAVWPLQGAHVDAGYNLPWTAPASSGWTPVGTGDVNQDNRVDVLWHHGGTGQVSAWYVKGNTVLGHGELSWTTTSASGWRIVSH